MGLDQFSYRIKKKPTKDVDFGKEIQENEGAFSEIEIAYWRKHPNLQGALEQIYRNKGGEKEEFNCVPVLLDLEDLRILEEMVKANMLPHTEGFYFGVSDETDDEPTLKWIKEAREVIAEGDYVYYSSWW